MDSGRSRRRHRDTQPPGIRQQDNGETSCTESAEAYAIKWWNLNDLVYMCVII